MSKRLRLVQRLEPRVMLDGRGTEDLVNALVPRLQTSEYQSTALEVTPDGDSLVVYSGRGLTDSHGVFVRRIRADGTAGPDQRVNTTIAETQQRPSVAVYEDGSYVIAWDGRGAGDQQGIFARWYDAGDQPISGEVLINTIVPGSQSHPDVAVDASGTTIFVWSGTGGAEDPQGIYRRAFAHGGAPLSDQFRVNVDPEPRQVLPGVAMAPDGRSVVTWSSHDVDSGRWDVYFRMFDTGDDVRLTDGVAANDPPDREQTVSAASTQGQFHSRVGMDAEGAFAVAWAGFTATDDLWNIYVRSFDSEGTPRSATDQLVNTQARGVQKDPDLAMAEDGRFVVSWTSGVADGSGWEVFAKVFTAGGDVAEADYLVNATSGENSGHQGFSAVAIGQGPAQIAWSGSGAIDRRGVWIQRTDQAARPRIGDVPSRVIDEQTTLRIPIPAIPSHPTQRVRFDLQPFSHPVGMIIDPDSGLLSWTPSEADGPGEFTAVVIASDADQPHLQDRQQIRITVREVNRPPTLDAIAPRGIDEGEVLEITPRAVDPDLPANTLTYHVRDSPSPNLSVDPTTGVIRWETGEADGPGQYTFTLVVTDNGTPGLSSAQPVTVTVREVNAPPVIEPIHDAVIPEQVPYSLGVRARDTDNSGEDGSTASGLRYSVDPASLSRGITISTAGVLRWTPREEDGPGSYPVAITVTDAAGATATATFTIDVQEVNRAPRLAEIPTMRLEMGDAIDITASASDPDRPDNGLRYALDAESLSRGARIDAITGRMRWTPGSAGLFPVTVTVTDDGIPPLSDSRTFTVAVDALFEPPEFTAVDPQQIQERSPLRFSLAATPGAPGRQVRYALALGAPSGLEVDAVSGEVRWTPTEAQGPASYEVSFEAFDPDAPELRDSVRVTIDVLEVNEPPRISAPSDRVLDEGDTLAIAVHAVDDDLPANRIQYAFASDTVVPTGMTINPHTGEIHWETDERSGPGSWSLTITATDDGSPPLSDSASFRVTVRERNQPPAIEDVPDQVIDEMTPWSIVIPAFDPDLPRGTLTYQLDSASVASGMTIDVDGRLQWTPDESQGPGHFPVTVTVRDDAEQPLSASTSFGITVRETNRAPVLNAVADRAISAGEAVRFDAVAIDQDQPRNSLRYSLRGDVPPGVEIDPDSGAFQWQTTASTAPGSYDFWVRVTDDGQPNLFDEQPVSIEVLPARLPLVEEERFVTAYEQIVVIEPGTEMLRFRFQDLVFDLADEASMRDAFEAALVDDSGNPLAAIVAPGRDAFFNHTERQTILLGGGTWYARSGSTVTVDVDVSHLPAGTEARLIQRLVNNDQDDTSRVLLFPGVEQIASAPHGEASLITPSPFAREAPARAERESDDWWRHVVDVTTALEVRYDHTVYDTDTHQVAAGITLTNTADYPLRGPLLVAVSGITLAEVAPIGYSGTIPLDGAKTNSALPDRLRGAAYWDVTALVEGGELLAGQSARMLLPFRNPTDQRFGYRLDLLAAMNHRPEFTTTAPESVRAGNVYHYPADAHDPDDDPLRYALLSGPEGMDIDADSGVILWETTAEDVGSHEVLVQTVDPYGLEDRQWFRVEVISPAATNRPPVFVTDPVVDAHAGAPYVYAVRAFDPDFDALAYEILRGPPGMVVADAEPADSSSGPRLQWTPAGEHVGQTIPVTVRADDGRGGEALQSYHIRVQGHPDNLPPQIVTTPSVTFRIPGDPTGEAMGPVSHSHLQQLLSFGQSITVPVSVEVNEDVYLPTADFVLVVDESASMEEQGWIADLVGALDQSLVDRGITGNRFAIVGFGGPDPAPRVVTEQADYAVVIYGPSGAVLDRAIVSPGHPAPDFAFPVDGRYSIGITRASGSATGGLDQSVAPTDPLEFQMIAALDPPVDANRAGWGSYQGQIGDGGHGIPFSGAAGDRLFLDGLEGAGITVTVIGPSGEVLFEPRDLMDDVHPVVLDESGEHQVRLSGPAGRPFSLRLLDPRSDAEPIDQGTVVSGTLDDPDQMRLYRMEIENDSLLYLDRLLAHSGTITPSTPDDFDVRVFGPDGQIAESRYGDTPMVGAMSDPLDVGPATTMGVETVTIVVSRSGRFGASDGAVPFGFEALDTAAATTALAPGVPAAAELDSPLGTEIFGLQLEAGDVLDLAFSETSGGPARWQLIDPFGLAVAEGPLNSGRVLVGQAIRTSGTYRILIGGNVDSTSATEFTIRADVAEGTAAPWAGQSMELNTATRLIQGATGDAARFTVDLEPGQRFLPIRVAGFQSPWRMRSPSGGIVFTEEGSAPGVAAVNSVPRAYTAVEGGRYLIEFPLGVADGELVFQIATATESLPVDQDYAATVDPSGGMSLFSVDVLAGQRLVVQSTRPDDYFADATLAAERAGYLRTSGEIEDGFWGLNYALDRLSFRDAASRHVLMLTDEDRDLVSGDVTASSLLAKLSELDAHLHSVTNTRLYSTDAAVTSEALGIVGDGNADGSPQYTLFHPTADGGYIETPAPTFFASGRGGNTGREYLDLAMDAGGSTWDVDFLRSGDGSRIASFTSALLGMLTETVARAPTVSLISTELDAPLTFGPGTVDGPVATFPVTFTGDGDAWNFSLDFIDSRTPGVVYGSIPVTIAGSYTYDARAVDPDDDPVQYALISGPGDSALDSTSGSLRWSPTEPGAFSFDILASDPYGGSDSQQWVVRVVEVTDENVAPEVSRVSSWEQEVGRPIQFSLEATDKDGDALTYQLMPGETTRTLPPAGMEIDPRTGQITWTPAREQIGSHEISARVVDGHGGRDAVTFTIHVVPPRPHTNHPPEFTATPIASAVAGHSYRSHVSAIDLDEDPLRYDLPWAPEGMVIDASGVLAWRPEESDVGEHLVVVRADDGQGGVTLRQFMIDVYLVNEAPVLVSAPNPVAVRGSAWQYQPLAEDPNGDLVRFYWSGGQGPDGVTMDAETGRLSWVPAESGTYPFHLVADDARGGRTSHEFMVRVAEDAPPEFLTVPTGPVLVGAPFERIVVVRDARPAGGSETDSERPPEIRLTSEALARGATLEAMDDEHAPENGMAYLFRWRPDAVGPATFVLVATDAAGQSTEARFTLEAIQPTAPTSLARFQTVPLGPAVVGTEWTYSARAIDPDGDEVEYALGPDAPVGMVIDSRTGLVRWTPTASHPGHTVSITATDSTGATGFQSFALAAVEAGPNRPPRFTSLPMTRVAVGDAWTYQVQAFDPDGGGVRYALDQEAIDAGVRLEQETGTLTLEPAATGAVSIVLTATDARGASVDQAFVLQIEASQAPPPRIDSIPTGPAVVGQTWTYRIEAFGAEGASLTFSLDPPLVAAGLQVDRRTGLVTFTPNQTGVVEGVVTVSDEQGNAAQQTLNLWVLDAADETSGAVPRFLSLPRGPAHLDTEWVYVASALSPDSRALEYRLDQQSLDRGALIDPDSGRLSWTASEEGLFPFTITATDDTGRQRHQQFTLEVVRTNRPPVIDSSPTGTAVVGRTWRYDVAARDPDGVVAGYALDAESLARGMTISDAGELRWTPTAAGTVPVVVTAHDAHGGSATQAFALTVAPAPGAPSPPRFRSLPPITTPLGVPLLYPLSAVDPDSVQGSGGPIAYALRSGPEGMSIDRDSGYLTWLPHRIGEYDVVVEATDVDGLVASQQFRLSVVPGVTVNAPPEILSGPLGPAVRDRAYRYPLKSTDANGDVPRYSLDAASIARNMHIDDDGVLHWLPTVAGHFPVTVTVSDVHGASVAQTFTLTVLDNAPPYLDPLPPRRVPVDTEVRFDIVASDANGDTVAFELIDGPEGSALDGASGRFTWTPRTTGKVTFAVRVTDAAGGSDLRQQTITVFDPARNAPPRIVGRPRESVPFDQPYVYQIAGEDPDGESVSFQLLSGPEGLTISPEGLLRWTPSASQVTSELPHEISVSIRDEQGETVRYEWTIHVPHARDNESPTIAGDPQTLAVAGREYGVLFKAQDPDGDSILWSLEQAPDEMVIDEAGWLRWRPSAHHVGTHRIVIRASDTSGGSDSFAFDLEVRGGNHPARLSGQPPTHHAVGKPYATTFSASDPDGDEVRVEFAPDGPSHGATLDTESGALTWTPAAPGEYPFRILARDAFGEGTVLAFTVAVDATGPNAPPRFNASSFGIADAGEAYRRMISATDPEGDSLTYLLVDGPEGMEIDAHGVLTWTPAVHLRGTAATVAVQVTDVAGNRAVVRGTLPVEQANRAPEVDSVAATTITAGAVYQVDVPGRDADGDPLRYSLISGPSGLTLDADTGRVLWPTDPDAIGDHVVEVALADDRAAQPTLVRWEIRVVADTQAPTVVVQGDRSGVNTGEPVTFLVLADDDVAVVERALIVDGRPVALDSQGYATVVMDRPGRYSVAATAVDAAGNRAAVSTEVVVRDPSSAAPTLEILSPAPSMRITEPVDVIVRGADPEQRLSRVELWLDRPDGALDAPRLLHERVALEGQFLEPLESEILARFDPTLLENGAYVLTVRAEDAEQNVTERQVTVNVEGMLKLGSFSAGFVDLDIAVAGLPLTVRRVYNSLNRDRRGDFGYGWSLDIGATNLTVDQTSIQGVGSGRYAPFAAGTRVVVTLPDGSSEGFTFQPVPGRVLAGAVLDYLPHFEPDAGNRSTLAGPSHTLRRVGNEFVTAEGATYNPADPAISNYYQLTTDDGLRRTIDASTGRMVRVVGAQGAELVFEDDAIHSNRGASVLIERDHRNRIAAIIDPRGNRITYHYDDQDRLVAVTDRIENNRSAQSRRSSTLLYHEEHPRLLKEVVDAEGITLFRNAFDSAGRLTGQYDAFDQGPSSEFDVNQRRQTMSAGGQQLATMIFDAEGRIATVEDYAHASTHLEFSTSGKPERIVRDIHDPTTGQRIERLEYAMELDAAGRVLSRSTPGGATSYFTYDDRTGNLVAEVDSAGNRTLYRYDDLGALEATTDAHQQMVRYERDAMGNVVAAHTVDVSPGSNAGCLAEAYERFESYCPAERLLYRAEYDEYGRETKRIDDSGGVVETFYDANHNIIRIESRTADSPGTTRVEETVFDEGDRPVLTRSFVQTDDGRIHSLLQTERRYDATGRLLSESSPNGLRAGATYDAAGRAATHRTIDTEGNVLVSYLIYDPMGREHVRTDPAPEGVLPTTGKRMHYDPTDQLIRTDSLIGLRIAVSEREGRPYVELVDPGKVLAGAKASPDALNHPGEIATEDGRSVTRIRDREGRTLETRTTVRGPDGSPRVSITRTVYDELGRVATATDSFDEQDSAAVTGVRRVYAATGEHLRTDQLTGVDIQLRQTPDGHWTSIVVDAGQLVEHDRLEYDEAGRLLSRTEPDGQRTTYRYDGKGREVQRATIPAGDGESASIVWTVYDDEANATLITQSLSENCNPPSPREGREERAGRGLAAAGVLSNEVPRVNCPPLANARPSRREGEVGVVDDSHLGSQPAHVAMTAEGATGLKATRTFRDAGGRVTRVEHLEDVSIVLRPMAAGRVATELVGAPTTVAWRSTIYDAAGRPVREVNEDGGVDEFVYDALGHTVSWTGPEYWDVSLGTTARPRTVHVYEGARRLSTTSGTRVMADGTIDRSLERTTKYQYDDQGRPVATILPDGSVTRVEYNQAGLKVAEIDTAGRVTRFEYTDNGAVSAIVQPMVEGDEPDQSYHPRTEFEYDDWGNRVVTRTGVIQRSDGSLDYSQARQIQDTYDSAGRLVAITRPEDLVERRFYGDDGKIADVVRPDGSIESYVWSDDPLTPGLQRTEYYATQEDFEAGRTLDFTHSLVQPDGSHVQTYAGGTTRRVYDDQDQLVRLATETGEIRYDYDAVGRVRAVWTTDGDGAELRNRVEYAYDSAGRIATIRTTHRNGEEVTSEEVYSYAYDVFGNLAQLVHPDGTIERYGYDALGRTQSVEYLVGDATPETIDDNAPLARFEYSFDASGHRSGALETFWNGDDGASTERRLTYEHDGADRLVSQRVESAGTTSITTYAYDAAHNRTSMAIDQDADGATDLAVRYTYDRADRILAEETFVDGIATMARQYRYAPGATSPSGIVTREAATDSVLEEIAYEYDARGNLTAAETREFVAGEDRVRRLEWQHDPSGLLVGTRERRTVDGEIMHDQALNMVVDELSLSGHSQLFEARDAASGDTVAQVTAGHRVLAEADGSGTVTSLLVDAIGSVRVRHEHTGGSTERVDYGPFGNLESPHEGQQSVRHGFAGELQDPVSEMIYLRRRMYTPGTGRFLQADSFSGVASEPISIHRYLYGSNAPLTYRDPSGNLFVLIDGTWNHDSAAHLGEGEDFTNVYQLRETYNRRHPLEQAVYERGVGNPVDNGHVMSVLGGGFGLGLDKITESALTDVKQRLSAGLKPIYMNGFSRGAIAILELAHRIEREIPAAQIRMMGIFDPVASVGFPGNGINLGYNLSLARNVREAFTLVSFQEDRGFFPGTNLHTNRATQLVTWGVHSDVGGGYGTEPFPIMRDALYRMSSALITAGLRIRRLEQTCECGPKDTHHPHKITTYLKHGGQTFQGLARPMVEHPMPGELGMAFFAEEMEFWRVGWDPLEAQATRHLWIPARMMQINLLGAAMSKLPLGNVISPIYRAFNIGALHSSHLNYWINRI